MEGLNTGEEYEGRSDLGNTQKGDGKRFKERGPIQVTGRANYEKIYKEFFIPNGLGEYDIVKNPELGSNPTIGALMSMGWLLTTDSGDRAIRASNRHNVKDLTKAINGGYNGLASRIQITEELLNNYKNS
jgi:putative chitinase